VQPFQQQFVQECRAEGRLGDGQWETPCCAATSANTTETQLEYLDQPLVFATSANTTETQLKYLDQPLVFAEGGVAIHQLLQVQVHILKDKEQSSVAVDDVVELYHIPVTEFLQ
jgi:hypothetical protein